MRKIKILITLITIIAVTTLSPTIIAASSVALGTVASNVTGGFSNVAKLITGAAFVAGLGFALLAIFKFKGHRDNPQQIPVGTPIALLVIAAALIFTPSLFGVLGTTIFGAGAKGGNAAGTTNVSVGGG